MKKVSIPFIIAAVSFILYGCPSKMDHHEFINSTDQISDIILIDRNEANNLSTFAEWIDEMPGKKFFIILKNYKPSPDKDALIAAFRRMGNVTIFEDGTSPSHDRHICSTRENFIEKHNMSGGLQFLGTGLASSEDEFTFTQIEDNPSGDHKIYISNFFFKWISANDSVRLRDSLIKFCAPASIADTFALPSFYLPGGNYLVVSGHLFIGYTYWHIFTGIGIKPDELKDSIRSWYHVSYDNDHMHLIGVTDANYNPTLYHLDLMMTCVEQEGTFHFFMPQIMYSDLSSPYVMSVKLALDTFRRRMTDSLNTIFRDKIDKVKLDSVPAFVDFAGRFMYSPVNGVADGEKYYFPYIDVRGEAGIDYKNIILCRDSALRVFQRHLDKKNCNNVIPLNIPMNAVRSVSQSLHCSMAIARRKGH